MTMTNNWLVLNIPLAVLAFVVVVGVPLWALWRFSADELFGRPDRPSSGTGGARPGAELTDATLLGEPYPAGSVEAERPVLVSTRR